MDFDDAPLKKTGPLTDLEREDLSTISVEELEERIERLHIEIERTRTEVTAKTASRSAAEAFFKS